MKSGKNSLLLIITLVLGLCLIITIGEIKLKRNTESFLAKIAKANSGSTKVEQIHVPKTKFINKFKTGNAKYAILGDSITDAGNNSSGVTGGASSPDKGYATLLMDKIKNKFGEGIKFDNRGIGGQTVKDAFNRVDKDIIPNDYDLILVELGTNDWNYGTNLQTFEGNYRELLQKLKSETNADIVCIGLGWFDTWKGQNSITSENNYNEIIKKLSSEFKLKYIDIYSAMKDSGKSFNDITYTPDPVHPNDVGHKIWANTIYNNLFGQ